VIFFGKLNGEFLQMWLVLKMSKSVDKYYSRFREYVAYMV